MINQKMGKVTKYELTYIVISASTCFAIGGVFSIILLVTTSTIMKTKAVQRRFDPMACIRYADSALHAYGRPNYIGNSCEKARSPSHLVRTRR